MRATVVETVLQTAATATGNGTSMDVSGYETAIFHVVSSVAMSGGTTVNFEATCDGTNWVALTAQKSGTATAATSTTSDGDYRASVTAFQSIRARISGYSAGTTTVTGYATNAPASFVASSSAMTVADGADVAEGATADAAVITDTTGTVSGKLRGLVKWAYERMPAALGQGTMATSFRVVLPSDQASVPVAATLQAGTALVGVAVSPNQTGVIYSGTTAVTPAQALANIAASQSHSAVVALTANKVIRVLALAVQCGGTATTIVFETSTGNAAISPTFQNAANGGVVLPYNPLGWFDTTSGDALNATTGAGSTTGIQVVYAKI